MSANADRIGLATADLWANITDEIHDVSRLPVNFGGFSQIHTGVWRSTYGEMKVAIKVIHVDNTTLTPEGDELPAVLQREVSVWKKLVHRNIHIMCGFFKGFGSAPALVSPWYDNGDIKSYVRRHATDPDVDMLKLKLLADAMTGLTFLHKHLIVHGDIKGANVLISDDGVARLCDFGLSRLLEHSQSITHTGVKGTLRWMAPELLLDEVARHSYASDMWACGCLCIEVWSNQKPYHTKPNDQQVILALSRKEPPARPSNMSDALWTVVQACCSFAPERRPQPLQVVAHISSDIVMQRVYRTVTLGRPSDSSESDILREIETSLQATDRQNLAGFYILSDAELATEVVRLFSLQSISPGHSGRLKEAVFHWCLAKLGTGNVNLPAGVYIPSTGNNDFFFGVFDVSQEPAKLHPLARLVELARPGLAKLFMSQFATPALGSPFRVDTVGWSVAWFSDGNHIAVGCGDATIRVLDLATGVTLLRLVGHRDEVRQVSVSPNGRLLASCSRGQGIRLWDAETGLAIGAPMTVLIHSLCSVAFSPDGRHIVAGYYYSTIHVWSTETCTTVLGPLRGHTGPVQSVAYSPDVSRIVSGSMDKTVRVWDARKGNTILTLRGHAHWVQSVAYSPDGLHILSGSNDRTVRIWDATTGQEVGAPLKGHFDWVRSVAYSPDGTCIVSGSHDRTIRIWDAATGASIATIRGHTDSVYSVAFSPDGKRLASASGDGTVRIWDATDDWRRWDI